MQQQHLASARNRRLAQQMENRPSVQAALNQKQVRPTVRQVHVAAGRAAEPARSRWASAASEHLV